MGFDPQLLKIAICNPELDDISGQHFFKINNDEIL